VLAKAFLDLDQPDQPRGLLEPLLAAEPQSLRPVSLDRTQWRRRCQPWSFVGVGVLVVVRSTGLALPTNVTPRYGLRLGLGILALVLAAILAE